MSDRDDLIKKLGNAFRVENEDDREGKDYRFEHMTVDDASVSRLLNITKTDRTVRKMSDEMIPVMDLSAFLKKSGTTEARGAELLLQQCLDRALEDDDLMKKLSQLASELLVRFRGVGENKLQQSLVIAHCENCLKQL